ncbi:MAG: dihydrolipoyl dehydrogenase [Candidatus Marinimicrobia bacterium]|nr:dihydrolipoyl dehydrogenase [Candidatus Neomarinimicrobiota bacterium]|tara:strand:- start:7920 stop:9311 length:1392 start_codon:yes stop_codon:yes gene_type:complete
MDSYDLAVLGGGPGGYVAAIRSAQLGMKTCIVEKDKLGGICLNWGCIPTKALLKNAEVYNTIKNAEKYGIRVEKVTVDFHANIMRSRFISNQLNKGIEFLMKKNNITYIRGIGELISNTAIKLANGKNNLRLNANKIIIATGARPRTLKNMDIDGKRVISYKEAIMLDKVPKTMIIIGSGAIGCELASYFNEFGTNVHLIEMSDSILPLEDKDVSKEVAKNFKNVGIKVCTGAKVLKIDKLKTKVKVYFQKQSGKKQILEGSQALLAVGVTGNIENIGLKKLGVITEKGAILINEFNQTNISNIYAIGDVTGPPWLAHVASAQGYVAVDHAAGKDVKPLDYSNIPGCTYCQPQVGSLGFTETDAINAGIDIKVGKFSFEKNGKAMAMGSPTGFVKLIFDTKYGELIGAHIVGSEATELIAELSLAKSLESTWEDIAMMVHAHPTLSEAIMEAALDAYGSPIHQ